MIVDEWLGFRFHAHPSLGPSGHLLQKSKKNKKIPKKKEEIFHFFSSFNLCQFSPLSFMLLG